MTYGLSPEIPFLKKVRLHVSRYEVFSLVKTVSRLFICLLYFFLCACMLGLFAMLLCLICD